MADEPENHTLHVLREMRAAVDQGFEAISHRFDALDAKIETLNVAVAAVSAGQKIIDAKVDAID